MFSPDSFKSESFHPASWAGLSAVVEPEEPATGCGGGFGGGGGYVLTRTPRNIRKRLAGQHQGANWSTGTLQVSSLLAGLSIGRSVLESSVIASIEPVGESSQRLKAVGTLRLIKQPSKLTQRNALALLSVMAARKRK